MAAQDGFKIVAIAGRTDAAGAAVADCDQEELRLPIGAMLGPGLLPNMLDQTANPNAYRVRQDTGSNMQVKVGNAVTAKIDGLVLRGTVAGQGSYIMRGEGTSKTITVPAADATNPSRYAVFAFVNDTSYSGTASRAYCDVSCIRGTPAGSPVTPGPLAAWSAYVLLWEFQLPALATAVTNTILDSGTAFDRRTPSVSPVQAASSPRAFATAALRDAAITVPTEGMLAAVTGEDRLYQYSGSAWQRIAGYSATGRTSLRVDRAANQSIPNNTATQIIWDTITVSGGDTWIAVPSTTITIPAGLGGLYVVGVRLAWAADPSTTPVVIGINGTTDYYLIPSVGMTGASAQFNVAASMVFPFSAADAFVIKVLQTSGSAKNITGSCELFRLAV